MLASLALHILLLGTWWFQSPYSSTEPSASPAESVMEVSILSNTTKEMSGPGEPTPAVHPEQAALTPGDHVGPVGQEVPVLTIGPVLPLKEAPYIPAGELDERPSSEIPVIIPFPDTPLDSPRVAGILVLYIGANGYVDRIEVDESDLPPEFEKAAIDTFLQARMRPGLKDGQPVRARMKIVVEFEQQ